MGIAYLSFHVFVYIALFCIYFMYVYIYIYIITNNINDYSLGYSFFNWTINKIVYIARLFLPPLLLLLLSGRPFSFLPRFDSFFLFSISFFRFNSISMPVRTARSRQIIIFHRYAIFSFLPFSPSLSLLFTVFPLALSRSFIQLLLSERRSIIRSNIHIFGIGQLFDSLASIRTN